MVKMYEIKDAINLKLTDLIGTKVDTTGTFHEDIRDRVYAVLNELNVYSSFRYTPWDITLDHYNHKIGWVGWNCDKIFKLKLDMNYDKRYSWKSVGKVVDLKFEVVDENTSDLTVEQLISYKAIESKEMQIDECENIIQSLSAEIEKKTEFLNKLKTELEQIKNSTNI